MLSFTSPKSHLTRAPRPPSAPLLLVSTPTYSAVPIDYRRHLTRYLSKMPMRIHPTISHPVAIPDNT